MYKGKTIYTRLALDSILEKFQEEGDYRKKYTGEEGLSERKGCFVSLHMKNGELRGCIGTLSPYRENLLEEIVGNAKSAAFGDPRFSPVRREELEDIEISVDVLEEAERVESLEELDPRIYGVIVAKNGRRGVLLPDLPGVDTVKEQVEIAMAKAGIGNRDGVELYRFRVKRYH